MSAARVESEPQQSPNILEKLVDEAEFGELSGDVIAFYIQKIALNSELGVAQKIFSGTRDRLSEQKLADARSRLAALQVFIELQELQDPHFAPAMIIVDDTVKQRAKELKDANGVQDYNGAVYELGALWSQKLANALIEKI